MDMYVRDRTMSYQKSYQKTDYQIHDETVFSLYALTPEVAREVL